MQTGDWDEINPYITFEGLGIRCPKCDSDDIVIEEIDGYYSFSICKKCGYRKEKKKIAV